MYSLRHVKVSKGVKDTSIKAITNITPAPQPNLMYINKLSYLITVSSVTDFIILSTACYKVSFNANIFFE